MLTVKLEGSKLMNRADELSARGLRNVITRAVGESATAARRVALQVIACDIGAPKGGTTQYSHQVLLQNIKNVIRG